jgi:hypothetical protein
MDNLVVLFNKFEIWFNAMKSGFVTSISPNSANKISFVISRLQELFDSPDELTERQWSIAQCLLTQGPSKISEELGKTYSSARGKWKGQAKQILEIRGLCDLIAQSR